MYSNTGILMTNQRDDYDNPWKEAISLYFQDFMRFFFPEIEANIDWNYGYEFLDSEFQKIVREAEIGRREADKLVKVWRKDGQEIWVLIHIEVQSQAQPGFPERMYVYNNRIFDMYRRQVVSLAILADDQPNWRPNLYKSELWGCRVELEFPTVKLLDYQGRSNYLENETNPFAVIVAAHLTTQQTKKNVNSRYQGKLKIAKSLYQRGYSRQDIIELFRLIDWIMTLPKAIENQFISEYRNFEEEQQMPYLAPFERIAREEGAIEGAIQQGSEDLLEVLNIRFSDVPNELFDKINQIEDLSILKTLFREAITINDLASFQTRLEQLLERNRE